MLRKYPLLFILSFLILFSSCSEYPKILKNQDMKQKLEWAEKLYKKGDYARAQPLYEQLAVYYRLTILSEDLQYFNAYCFYGMKDYEMSTYLFKRFCHDFPTSKRAEECNYMFCLTEYKSSLPINLDQSDTKKCMDDIAEFIGLYPDSKYIPYCNELSDKLRQKLEMKAYNAASLFYKTEEYRAAAVSFTNLIKDFPETSHKEEAEFKILKSYYLFAQNSTDKKKAERYRQATLSFEEYHYDFKDTYADEARKMHEEALKQIEKYKSVN